MRKPELAAAIATQAGLTKDKASEVLNAITDEITKAVARGEAVNLLGFGSFVVKKRSARSGKNPRTGEPIEIPAGSTVGFRPGKLLKDALKGG